MAQDLCWIYSIYTRNQVHLTCREFVYSKLQLRIRSEETALIIDNKVCLDYLNSSKVISLLNKRLALVFEESLAELQVEVSKSFELEESASVRVENLLKHPKYFHLLNKKELVVKRLLGISKNRYPTSVEF